MKHKNVGYPNERQEHKGIHTSLKPANTISCLKNFKSAKDIVRELLLAVIIT